MVGFAGMVVAGMVVNPRVSVVNVRVSVKQVWS